MKVMITTMNSKRDKHEDVKEDIKVVKCGGGEDESKRGPWSLSSVLIIRH